MKWLLFVLFIIAFANINSKQNSPQKVMMVKQTRQVPFVKKPLSHHVNDALGCIIFPKSSEFLKILKKAGCTNLPVNITYDNETKKGVKFTSSDSSIFGKALKGSHMELINRVAVLEGGSPDDFSGIDDRGSKYLPLVVIFDTKDFVIVSIRKIEPNSPVILICSFTSAGKFIDGFVANYGNGNEHWNVSRESVIDKEHLIKITETGQGNQSDDDNYFFSATWKTLDNGHFKRIKQRVKYGSNYQSDDGRFTKIK